MPLLKQEAKFALLIVASIFLCISTVGFAQVVEKNYFSTDKDIYAPKDTIWFKGYVFDMNNVVSTQSIAYHVLMVDSEGTKLVDTSWPINGGVTDGYFTAPNYEGRFRIIAVSGQMIGAKAEQLFSKDVFVRSDLADEIEVLAFPQFEKFSPGQDNLVDIFTQFSTNAIAPDVKLTYQVLSGGQRLKRGKLTSSDKGKVTLDLKGLETQKSDLTLVIDSEDKRLTKSVKLALPLPISQKNIDLQFFPEGGQMLHGLINSVAFKAIDENGEPFDFKGLIVNGSGEVVGSAESFYQGMGALKILPESGKEYFFQVNSPYKVDSLFKLPNAVSSGISLSLSEIQKDGKQYAVVRASEDLIGKKGQLVISKNTQTISKLDFEFSTQENWEIAYENLDIGTYSFKVIDENGMPLAERLLFANAQRQLKVNIKTDKANYEAREKVETHITITDAEGRPVQGNFSMTAVDNTRAKSPIGLQPNLLAQILLTSELRGQIPTPNFYFSNNEKANKALDLVMMTNGWRKYSPSTIEDPEGLVGSLHKTNRKRKLLKDRKVTLTPFRNKGLDFFDIDSAGIFRIPSTYLRNRGDSFLIFSNKLSKKDKFSIRQNQAKRIQKGKALSAYLKLQVTDKLATDLSIYKKAFKLRPDQFQNTILLNSVVVEANKTLSTGGCELEDYHFEAPWSTKRVDELDITDPHIVGLLKQVSIDVVKHSGGRPFGAIYDVLLIKHKNALLPTRLEINCQPVDVIEPAFFSRLFGDYKFNTTLNRIDLSNLESISINNTFVRTPGFPPDYSDWTFPIININTINDQVIYKPIFDMKFYHSTYQNYTKEFYSPVYKTEKQKKDRVPDLRTTIFWQANVFTDQNGEVTITYYNADRPNQIGITVEGVDAFSRLGYGTTTYQVLEGPKTEGDNRP